MRSRDSILEATRAVIGESSLHGVSIAGIAEQAGASRQTVYSIFGTREDLVSQAVTDRLTSLTITVDDPAARTNDQLREFVAVWVAPVVESL